jgi:hypothetical protein
MAWVAWVVGLFDNFWGLPLTPPDIEVLDGRELGTDDVLGCPYHTLYRFVVKGGA